LRTLPIVNKYDDIQIVAVDFRGVMPNLRRWLDEMPNVKYASDICSNSFRGIDLLAVWRNQIAEWFLKNTDKGWLVTFDDDVIPCEATAQLLECRADVAACHFFARSGFEGHGNDGSVSMAALKVARRALERIERPWFKFHFNDKHTKLVMCECEHFCGQARKAGFHPVKAGLVYHAMKVAIIPPSSEDDSCRMQFLHQLDGLSRWPITPEKKK